MVKKEIFVVGFYGKGNLGDQAFIRAFHELWGERAHFTFGGVVPVNIADYDALWIGGGSLLDGPIPGHTRIPDSMPIGFIGVGIHGTHIHPVNLPLLERAEIVIVRNSVGEDLSFSTFGAADLVFAREFPELHHKPVKAKQSLLVLGNSFLIPRTGSASWKVEGWPWFIDQLSTLLDGLNREGWAVTFFPMQVESPSSVETHDDRDFATAIRAGMSTDSTNLTESNEDQLVHQIRQADLVWSLRFHGNVFSTILDTPFLGIASHDKMWAFFKDNGLSNVVNYYGITGADLATAPAPSSAMQTVRREGKQQWLRLSAIVAEKFGL